MCVCLCLAVSKVNGSFLASLLHATLVQTSGAKPSNYARRALKVYTRMQIDQYYMRCITDSGSKEIAVFSSVGIAVESKFIVRIATVT